MPMATDGTHPNRRSWLKGLGAVTAVVAVPAWAGDAPSAKGKPAPQAAQPTRLAACWTNLQGAHQAGWLRASPAGIQVQRAVELPTRGHGLAVLPDGSLLVAARRPGDWLLRVPVRGAPKWVWMESGRVFSGHVWPSADSQTVFTTEIDTDSGQGLLGVRDARSLEKTAEWPTHGMDPHAVSRMPAHALGADGRAHPLAGALFVANGGIDTALETGRTKRHLHRMDSSVACLHPASGERLSQWRLDDPRLSLRHLAWAFTPDGQPLLGVALQAEHDDASARAAAPLLAVLDWQGDPHGKLRTATGQPPLAGYGGDVAALPAQAGASTGFWVSATRGHALAHYALDGNYQGQTSWAEAGALSKGGMVWAAGRNGGLPPSTRVATAADVVPPSVGFAAGRLDNHWA